MKFRPTQKSFLASLVWALLPVILASIVTYFMYESAHWFLWVADGFLALLSFFLLIQSISVHRQAIYLDDYCIRTSSLLSTTEMKWCDIIKKMLRERANAMSRTDRLLILESSNDILMFNISTLSPEDEEKVLAMVRKKIDLEVHKDSPSI